MGIVDGKTICQVALVVKNIEETAKAYAELFSVDVPDVFTVPPESEAHTKFKGQPTNTRAKLAVFDLGQVVLEITARQRAQLLAGNSWIKMATGSNTSHL